MSEQRSNIIHYINTNWPILRTSSWAKFRQRHRKPGASNHFHVQDSNLSYSYYQPNPGANVPFPVVSALNDPVMSATSDAWGLRILKSSNIFVYGAGLYSFFNNYSTSRLLPRPVQTLYPIIAFSLSPYTFRL